MILINNALKSRQAAGRNIRVGVVKAGFMGRGVARQICRYVPGLTLLAIINRTVEQARRAYDEAGELNAREVSSVAALERCIESGQPSLPMPYY